MNLILYIALIKQEREERRLGDYSKFRVKSFTQDKGCGKDLYLACGPYSIMYANHFARMNISCARVNADGHVYIATVVKDNKTGNLDLMIVDPTFNQLIIGDKDIDKHRAEGCFLEGGVFMGTLEQYSNILKEAVANTCQNKELYSIADLDGAEIATDRILSEIQEVEELEAFCMTPEYMGRYLESDNSVIGALIIKELLPVKGNILFNVGIKEKLIIQQGGDIEYIIEDYSLHVDAIDKGI